jgi:dUTP pyrophosphatase
MPRGFERIEKEVKLPKRATSFSAGYDFYLPEELTIKAHERVIVKTYIRSYMNDDEFLALYIRSSLGIKKGIRLMNQTGIIDKDYYGNSDNGGHIMIALENTSANDVKLEEGSAFAQGVFMKYLISDDDTTSEIRSGGIGSTNKSGNFL